MRKKIAAWVVMSCIAAACLGLPLGELAKPVLWCCVFGIAFAAILGFDKGMAKLMSIAGGLVLFILGWAALTYAMQRVTTYTHAVLNQTMGISPPQVGPYFPVALALLFSLLMLLCMVFLASGGVWIYARIRAARLAPKATARPCVRTRAIITEPQPSADRAWPNSTLQTLPAPPPEDELGLFEGELRD